MNRALKNYVKSLVWNIPTDLTPSFISLPMAALSSMASTTINSIPPYYIIPYLTYIT